MVGLIQVEGINAKEENIPTKVAICRSFKKAAEIAKKNGFSNNSKKLQYTFFAEDDILFENPKKSFEKFKMALDNLPEKWDIITGGTYYMQSKDIIKETINNHFKLLNRWCSMHFLLLNSNSTEKFIDICSCEEGHIDYLLSAKYRDKFNTYAIWPLIAKQIDDYSDNHETIMNLETYLIKGQLFI